jgi:hypothetical protein
MYAVEMGSGAMIYKPSFEGIRGHTDSRGLSQTYFYMFKIRKVS